MPLINPMPPMDVKALIIVLLRNILPKLLGLLSVGMGLGSDFDRENLRQGRPKVSPRQIAIYVTCHTASEDGDYTPSRSGRYTGYRVQFGSANEGKPIKPFYLGRRLVDRAHACLNLHVTNDIAPHNTLLVFGPSQRENCFSLFLHWYWGPPHYCVLKDTRTFSSL